jgi:SWI/SNF-related matrix-associated actin-dependent regulator of chromatin subfamily A3
MLTRMRQIVLHPGLIPSNYVEQLRKSVEEDALDRPIVTQDKARLQALLAQAIEDSEECPICFNILLDPRITNCGHSFCLNWYVSRWPFFITVMHIHKPCCSITDVITRDSQCPMVRN